MMPRPAALDLFCGAGGAARGLQRAGFFVVGVDNRPQPRYAGDIFIRGDALNPPVRFEDFDFVWASPPCERFTRCWRGQDHRRVEYADLIGPVREMLSRCGTPFVLENVPGAPLRADVVLTGAMFNLPIVRDRLFECHGFNAPFRLAPQHAGTTRKGDLAMVAGRGGPMKGWNLRNWENPEVRKRLSARNSIAGWREAMQMPWADRDGIRKAVPPAYAEFIGRAAMRHIRQDAA